MNSLVLMASASLRWVPLLKQSFKAPSALQKHGALICMALRNKKAHFPPVNCLSYPCRSLAPAFC